MLTNQRGGEGKGLRQHQRSLKAHDFAAFPAPYQWGCTARSGGTGVSAPLHESEGNRSHEADGEAKS